MISGILCVFTRLRRAPAGLVQVNSPEPFLDTPSSIFDNFLQSLRSNIVAKKTGVRFDAEALILLAFVCH